MGCPLRESTRSEQGAVVVPEHWNAWRDDDPVAVEQGRLSPMMLVELGYGGLGRVQRRAAGDRLLLGLGTVKETTARVARRGEDQAGGARAEASRRCQARLVPDLDPGGTGPSGALRQSRIREDQPGSGDCGGDLFRDVDATSAHAVGACSDDVHVSAARARNRSRLLVDDVTTAIVQRARGALSERPSRCTFAARIGTREVRPATSGYGTRELPRGPLTSQNPDCRPARAPPGPSYREVLRFRVTSP